MGRLTWQHLSLGTVLLVLACAGSAGANPDSDSSLRVGSVDLYNLDLEMALVHFREATAQDPSDAATYRALAGALWMNVAFDRGALTVDGYLGRVSRDDVDVPDPPDDVAAAFDSAVERAIALARRRLSTDPSNSQAHYDLGAAVGLRAAYAAMVRGSVRSAFGAARQAYNEHEKVLELDPSRQDAGLIVGSYRYLVASLALPMRWFAYMAGFGGDKQRGIEMVEAAARHGGDNTVDASVALVLLYNRERQYDRALAELAALRAHFPRNRLFWLESGATALRARRYVEANRVLSEGIRRFASDPRPRMPGEDALWYYKRGTARSALNMRSGAEQDFQNVLTFDGQSWIRGRAQLALGKLQLQSGNREHAVEMFRQSAAASQKAGDKTTASEAKELLRATR